MSMHGGFNGSLGHVSQGAGPTGRQRDPQLMWLATPSTKRPETICESAEAACLAVKTMTREFSESEVIFPPEPARLILSV